MEILLLVITAGSLAFALVMSVMAWRLSQDERRRSAARIAQLAAEAAVPAASTAGAPAALRQAPWAPPVPSDRPRVDVKDAPTESASTNAAESASVPAADEPRPTLRAFPQRAPEPAPVAELSLSSGFLATPSHEPESAGRQRGLAAAAAVLAVGLAGFVVFQMIGPGAQGAASARTAAAATPLELLSLRHDRVGSRLSVSGLVKNPSAGQAVERLYAVVFVFDQNGTFVTSGRAPVDFIRIAAGEESPFVVALDAPQSVARYRVSFRTDAGTVPHVDRRGAPVAAPVAEPVTVAIRD